MATEVNEIFSRFQPCQLVKNNRGIRDHLSPHQQGLFIEF
jgi:hypothetical protein